MGMFDTLHFKCPCCGEMTSEQSKDDDCPTLTNYDLSNAPLAVLGGVKREGDAGRLACEHCGKKLTLQVQRLVEAIPKPQNERDDD